MRFSDCEFPPKLRRRLLVALMVLGAVAPVCAADPAGATRDEVTRELRAAARRLAVADPDLAFESLAQIGTAQCLIADADGAAATLAIVPPRLRRTRAVMAFVERLVAAQTRQSPKDVFATVQAVIDGKPGLGEDECVLWLSVARAAKDRGEIRAAVKSLRNASAVAEKIEGDFRQPTALCRIALAQAEIEGKKEAMETLRQVVEHSETAAPASDIEWPQLLSQYHVLLAEAYWKVGDIKAARESLNRATAVIGPRAPGGDSAYGRAAITLAKLGDTEGALQLASKLPDEWPQCIGRDEALAGVAVILAERGKLDSAVETAGRIGSYVECRDKTLVRICTACAATGDLKKALGMSEKIDNPSRRAEAVLEVAGTMAQKGEKPEARRLAEEVKLSTTEEGPRFGVAPPQAFSFRAYETWGLFHENVDYEVYTIASRSEARSAAGDLTASAMRCRVLLEGKAQIAYLEAIEKWDVRKVARAQAASGDSEGAMEWVRKLSMKNRLAGLIGLAEGLAADIPGPAKADRR
jgi:tetratricopeptide (TPR) repeat protein